MPVKNKTEILVQQLKDSPSDVIVIETDTVKSLRRSYDKFSNQENTPLTPKTIDALNAAMDARKLHIGKVQADKGFLWLHKLIWTPKGVLRKTQNAEQFKAHHRAIMLDFSHFELADLEDVATGYRRSQHLPRYRVVGKDGSYFTYLAGSWQSGYGLDVR